ncbi:competence type IV pilus minor pilin ComGG [Streptococcus suis]|uniref:competence type IV pilus minor pilin ComGG n=1 Tax=Streptococcus suis TaxID=1307 RepID=UPI001ABEB444|nr:competence protein ComGG [Streptococcus suis]
MLLKKKVKAGILVYALLMLAVFSLLLQFYLHRQEAESQLNHVTKQEATAYIMAQMVLDQVEGDLQENQAVAEEVALQTNEKKRHETVISGEIARREEEEVQETTNTKPGPATKSVDTSSTQNVESKSIEDKGTVTFQEGQASYHVQNKHVIIIVALGKGGSYHYRFPVLLAFEGE